MKIIVLIKPVPDLEKIKISRGQGTIFETGKKIMNSYDRVGLQAAINLKKDTNGNVAVISISDITKTDILREAYAMGSDACYNAWEESFTINDASANARVLAAAIRKIGAFNLIICGAKSDTGFSGQTGPRVAEILNIPQVTSVYDIQFKNERLKVTSKLYPEKIISFPALITVDKSAAIPQIPNALSIMKAFKKEILHWTASDLFLNPEEFGEQGVDVTVRSKFLIEA